MVPLIITEIKRNTNSRQNLRAGQLLGILEFDLPQPDGFEELETEVWCVMRRPYGCTVFMENTLIANGAEVSRIGGGVKIVKKKKNEKRRCLGKILIFLQGRFK
jgi:hypothetical protein